MREFILMIRCFARRTAGIVGVTVSTADGTPLVSSDGVSRSSAERHGAIAVGMVSLSNGFTPRLAIGRFRKIAVELQGGFFFLSMVGHDCTLGVVTSIDGDLVALASDLDLFATKVEATLTPRIIEALRRTS